MQEFIRLTWAKVKDITAHLFQRTDLPHVLPFLGGIAMAHMFFWSTCWYMEYHTEAWYSERGPLAALNDSYCQAWPMESLLPCSRFVEQWTVATERAEHHFNIMRFYQVRYFGFLSTAFWTGVITACFLVAIMKSGWDDTDPRLRGMFLGVGSAAAFFGGFPTLISSEQNIGDNLAAYMGYDNLATDIRTVIVMGPPEDVLGKVLAFDSKLQALNQVHIQFDQSQIDLGKTKVLETLQTDP